MNPKRQFRRLRDDDRWLDLPPTTSRSGGLAQLKSPARGKSRSTYATTVVAFVIAGVVAIGLWAALSGIRHASPATSAPTATPTAIPSTTPPPQVKLGAEHHYTASVLPRPCTSKQIVVASTSAGGAGLGSWHLPVLLRNTGADCLLDSATSEVLIDGQTIHIDHGNSIRGAVVAAYSFATLNIDAPTTCTDQRVNIANPNGTEPVSMRIAGTDRTLPHGFPKTTCASPSASIINGLAFAATHPVAGPYKALSVSIQAPGPLTTGPLTYIVTITNTSEQAIPLKDCLAGTQDLVGLDTAGKSDVTVTQTSALPCQSGDRIDAGASRTLTFQTTIPGGQAWTLHWTLKDGLDATAT